MYVTLAQCQPHRSVFTYHSAFNRYECTQWFNMEGRETTYRRSKARLLRAVRTRALPLFRYLRSRMCCSILLENASSSGEGDERRARKRARGVGVVQGRHSQDMSLVTPENVHRRSQWRVTPLGRLIRPMRMRPARPLGPPLDVLKAETHQRGQQGKGRKRRARTAPPTRARRQTIDPLRWGSTHIGGVFLDGVQTSTSSLASRAHGGGGPCTNRESTEIEADEEVEEILDTAQSSADDNDNLRAASARPSPSVPLESESTDFAAEKARTLQLLNSMFGDANEDWGDAESIASDIEQAATESRANVAFQSLHDATADFDVVPVDQRRADENSSVDRHAQTATTAQRNPDPDPVHRPSTSKLKDIFAPREEEGEFVGLLLDGSHHSLVLT